MVTYKVPLTITLSVNDKKSKHAQSRHDCLGSLAAHPAQPLSFSICSCAAPALSLQPTPTGLRGRCSTTTPRRSPSNRPVSSGLPAPLSHSQDGAYPAQSDLSKVFCLSKASFPPLQWPLCHPRTPTPVCCSSLALPVHCRPNPVIALVSLLYTFIFPSASSISDPCVSPLVLPA